MSHSEPWMQSALCRQVDPELFFPSKDNPATEGLITTVRRAKEVCRQCPVQVQCLDAALANGERHGIWGGVNLGTAKGRFRHDLLRQRRIAAREPDFEHGGPTDAGARRHYRRGEKPCPECAASALRYGRERRA